MQQSSRAAAGQTWFANPNGAVNVVRLDPANTSVFLGGQFERGALVHHWAAIVDITTGAPKPAYNTKANDRVLAIDVSAAGVLIGGDFSSLGAQNQRTSR